MNLACIAVVIGLVSAGQGEVEVKPLIERLGASRYGDREEATKALEKLGRPALPALREARAAGDPEVRERVRLLIEKIEADWLVHATMVGLDFTDQPLTKVVDSISTETGIGLQLIPENVELWKDRKITLKSPIPVPFWVALDRLCEEAKLRHGVGGGSSFDPRTQNLQLFAGDSTTSDVPTFDSGPFRSMITRIRHEKERSFGQRSRTGRMGGLVIVGGGDQQKGEVVENEGEGLLSEQFFVQLEVACEPRMSIGQGGPVKLEECVDDKGQSLLPPPNSSTNIRSNGYFGMNSMAGLQTQVFLVFPEEPGQVIKRIRGSISVNVAARKDEPLVIPLAEAKGKTFETEEVSITINDLTDAPNNQPGSAIELSLRPKGAGPVGGDGVPMALNLTAIQAQQSPQRQIDILDKDGQVYKQWYPSSSRVNQEEAQLTLTVMPTEGVGPPTQIHFYSLTRATAEVVFEFRDVPMP